MQRSSSLRFLLLTGVTLLFGYACKKVIQVDLNNSIPQIVIEGEITNAAGPYLVKISKTSSDLIPCCEPQAYGAKSNLKNVWLTSGVGVYFDQAYFS